MTPENEVTKTHANMNLLESPASALEKVKMIYEAGAKLGVDKETERKKKDEVEWKKVSVVG